VVHGIVVPIDKALPKIEIKNIVVEGGSSAIFFEEKYTDTMKEIQQEVPSLQHLFCFTETNDSSIKSLNSLLKLGESLLEKNDTSFINSTIDNDALSVMLFTSGTTSKPKSVMLSHRNICSDITQVASVIKYYDNDVFLSFLPMHHIFESVVGFLMSIYNGACSSICRGLKHIYEDMLEYKPTIMCNVPLVLENIYKKIRKKIDSAKSTLSKQQILDMLGGKLRFIFFGAAPLGLEIILGYKDLGINTHHAYGSTETSAAVTVETNKNRKSGAVGYSLPQAVVEVCDPDATGLGEIRCKGPTMTLGYYDNKEATDEVLKDGWFYTGDLGYVDDEGYLFIAGRKKNVIVLKNGKNIFPEEIEVLLNSSPLVAESVAYASEKPNGDLELRAKVVYNKEAIVAKYGEVSEAEIENIMNIYRKEVNKNLPIYKNIRKISITDVPLIKTTSGKVRRAEEHKLIFK